MLTRFISGVDTEGAIWSVAETCVAVVSACLPTFRPLFSKAARKDKKATPQPEPHTPKRGQGDVFDLQLSTLKPSWTRDRVSRTGLSGSESFTRLTDVDTLESR